MQGMQGLSWRKYSDVACLAPAVCLELSAPSRIRYAEDFEAQNPSHFRRCRQAGRGGSDGFSLVELLVVIGLIATLIAILLPALNKARESANQVKCLSNERQVAAAMLMYANESRGVLPGATSQSEAPVHGPRPEDWIYWSDNRDIDQSAIAPYLGRGDALRFVLRCPSDNVDFRPGLTGLGWKFPYVYSYCMNRYLDGAPYSFVPLPSRGVLGHIRRSAEKILIAEVDERVIASGEWFPGQVGAVGGVTTWVPSNFYLSIRHDRPLGLADPIPELSGLPTTNPNRRGNVAFCDGHAEFVSREFAHSQEHADPLY